MCFQELRARDSEALLWSDIQALTSIIYRGAQQRHWGNVRDTLISGDQVQKHVVVRHRSGSGVQAPGHVRMSRINPRRERQGRRNPGFERMWRTFGRPPRPPEPHPSSRGSAASRTCSTPAKRSRRRASRGCRPALGGWTIRSAGKPEVGFCPARIIVLSHRPAVGWLQPCKTARGHQ